MTYKNVIIFYSLGYLYLTRVSYFCYYIDMAKNRSKGIEKESASNAGTIFVQSDIDDLLNDNLNQTPNEAEKELPQIEETLSNEKGLSNVEGEPSVDNTKELEARKVVKDALKTKENILEIKEDNHIEKLEKEYVESELTQEIEPKKEEIKQDDSDVSSIEVQRKKLNDAEQSVSKHNSKKNKTLNIVFFIVNILVVIGILVYQLTKEGDISVDDITFDFGYLFVTILLFGVVIFIDTLAIGYLLKQSTGKWRLGFCYKVAEIGRYYDCVTPTSSGGQPFQISYLKSKGMPLHTSLSIPLAKYEFQQMAWVVLSFICLVISSSNADYGTFVSVTSIIGFCLSAILFGFTVFLSVCKSFGKKLVVKILKLLHKMKIVKNYDKQYERITKYISDFQDVMKQYAKSPKDIIVMFFLSTLKYIVNYSMPFFIVKLFLPSLSVSYIDLFVMTMLVDISSSFFPLPGGTGLNEISFTTAFGTFISQGNILVLVLLVWRFFSYYAYLLQGVCIISYDIAYGNRKYKWQVRRDKLVEESMIFKQNQIDKFRADRAKRRKNKQKSSKNREYL